MHTVRFVFFVEIRVHRVGVVQCGPTRFREHLLFNSVLTHMSLLSRRTFLASAGVAGAGLSLGEWSVASAQTQEPLRLDRPAGPPEDVAKDERYWRRVAAHYRLPSDITNLEAGNFGRMAIPVAEAYRQHVERVNIGNSFYVRRQYERDLEPVRARVAEALGASVEEVALTRGATEALQCLIGGYNRLRPGDVVMYADLDYSSMQFAMNWLVDRRGAEVVRLSIPEPATRDNVLSTYAEALAKHPRTRLLLLTHLNNKTGLIIPVAEVAALARRAGADVIVDAAHSFGQVDLKLADMGADFVGVNFHKWFGAPVGVGVMYVKQGRLDAIDRMMADESAPADSILSRVHSGTSNFAAFLTVPAALDFHSAVGPRHKAERLRYLRDRWVGAVRGVPGIEVITPDDRSLGAAIASFRIGGRTTKAENQRIVEDLLTRYKLFTVARTGIAGGDCVRVTPAVYNAVADCDRLAAALKQLAAH
jgi:isopenicillin-N epimerase